MVAADGWVRVGGRAADSLRAVRLTRNYTMHAEGSVLAEFGNTRVLCNATVEDRVPAFLRGTGRGWLTAEYAMLPRATHTRMAREAVQGRPSGRSMEIQRLIGRSLRAGFDLNRIGERTVLIDCDVLQADGGTRTAAITGAFVAAHDAITSLALGGAPSGVEGAVRDFVAAVSAGWLRGQAFLDLDYNEDSQCETDLNLVMTGSGRIIEVQSTAEGAPISRADLDGLLDVGARGIAALVGIQRATLAGA